MAPRITFEEIAPVADVQPELPDPGTAEMLEPDPVEIPVTSDLGGVIPCVASADVVAGPFFSITWQDGPAKKAGRNGTQPEDVLEVVLAKLHRCQRSGPCRETALAITKVEEAILWLNRRTALRISQGVEGTTAPHKS